MNIEGRYKKGKAALVYSTVNCTMKLRGESEGRLFPNQKLNSGCLSENQESSSLNYMGRELHAHCTLCCDP